MKSNQKKIEAAKKRIDDRARKLLDPEVYKKVKEVGQAKYNSDEDFVKAVIDMERWVEEKEKAMKKAS